MDASAAFSALPSGLRDPLLFEYREIIRNYLERRWSPAELSGGKFCEIVYTILDGYGFGTYADKPKKPSDFVSACRKLENNSSAPRSFQILIPRMLPALYEVRNNRGVGHAGGDVNPNHMDATVVVSMANWVMAELVRVLHTLTIKDAQALVDSLAERQVPLVWEDGKNKRLLDPDLSVREQVLVLLASSPKPVSLENLLDWTGYKNRTYFRKVIGKLHDDREIFVSKLGDIQILPPGTAAVSDLLAERDQRLSG